jgi:phospholipid-binding lipoprotein MlaA
MKIKQFAKPLHSLLSSLLLASLAGGCASTPSNPDDPWEDWNRSAQSFNDDVDEYILKPMAKGYLFVTPEPLDRGVTNFFSNIDDIGVMINNLLQFKLTHAGMDMGRFLINTTAGVVGVFDVASMLDLPKHNEDFDQTLGVWGVPSGPYLVLPFWGPSSPRGMFGLLGDALTDPINYTLFAGAAVSLASSASDVLDVTDQRAGLMTTEKIVDEAAVNRYDFIKESYLQHRKYLINDGNIPEEDDSFDLDMDLDMEAEESGTEPSGHKLELSAPTQD